MALVRNLTLKLASSIINQKQMLTNPFKNVNSPFKENDTVFIRHAHSQFNKACQDYRIKHSINYDWEALCKHPGFQDQVAFNPMYIDCPLTKLGVDQCYSTSHNINFNNLDLIMVSPHLRALETCSNILKFSNKLTEFPVIVEPLIAGSLWSSCDVSHQISDKLRVFKQFDFSRMKAQPQLWFIQNLRVQGKMKIKEEISRRKIKTFKDQQSLVLEMIRTKQVQEDSQILRKRSWLIKKYLQKLKQKHTNILLISHYYVIQYVNSRSFSNVSHRPLDEVDLKNCYPYYNNLENLLSYK